jgi:hypothetical protein
MIDLNPIRFGTLAILVLAGCNGDPTGVSHFDLAVARDKWNRAGIEDYQVEFSFQGPFNTPRGFTRLQVRQGQVVSAQISDTLYQFTPPLDSWPTVPDVFDLIAVNLEHHPGSMEMAVDATFDENLGYPRRVTITCVPVIPDCGPSIYEFRKLKPQASIDRQ